LKTPKENSSRVTRLTVVALLIALGSAVWSARADENTVPCAASFLPGTAGTNAITTSQYRIGPGDVVQVTVWKEPEISVPAIQVRPDGKISMPLLGD
jgi:protein involved in polysaccharide export with SLBB domain